MKPEFQIAALETLKTQISTLRDLLHHANQMKQDRVVLEISAAIRSLQYVFDGIKSAPTTGGQS